MARDLNCYPQQLYTSIENLPGIYNAQMPGAALLRKICNRAKQRPRGEGQIAEPASG